MNVNKILEAWKASQNHETYDFYERFYQLTGLEEHEVKRVFDRWNLTRRDRVEVIAEKHGVTVEGGGFQAFLVERFWPEDPESKTLIAAARYLRHGGQHEATDEEREARIEGAKVLEHVLDCKARLGRPPIDYTLFDMTITGPGDPRESRGDWPPEEDCPHCPTGRKEDIESPHKMSCAWAKGESGRITMPLSMFQTRGDWDPSA